MEVTTGFVLASVVKIVESTVLVVIKIESIVVVSITESVVIISLVVSNDDIVFEMETVLAPCNGIVVGAEVGFTVVTVLVTCVGIVIGAEVVIGSGHFSPIETKPDVQKQAKYDVLLVFEEKNVDSSEHKFLSDPQISVR